MTRANALLILVAAVMLTVGIAIGALWMRPDIGTAAAVAAPGGPPPLPAVAPAAPAPAVQPVEVVAVEPVATDPAPTPGEPMLDPKPMLDIAPPEPAKPALAPPPAPEGQDGTMEPAVVH